MYYDVFFLSRINYYVTGDYDGFWYWVPKLLWVLGLGGFDLNDI